MQDQANVEEPLLDQVEQSQGEPEMITKSWGSFLRIALGVTASSFAWAAIKTTDSAIIGHLPKNSTEYLQAANLGDLLMVTLSSFLMTPALSILASQAIGAKDMGLAVVWLKIALLFNVCLTLVSLFIAFLSRFYLPEIYPALSHHDITLTVNYITIISVCMPLRVIMQSLSKYLTAHKKTDFLMKQMFVSFTLNLAFGLLFTLYLGYGFYMQPWVTVIVECCALVLYTWYYTSQKDVLFGEGNFKLHLNGVSWVYFSKYVRLFLPMAVSIYSDFVRFAIINTFAEWITPQVFAAFSTEYKILYLCMNFIYGLGTAAEVTISRSVGAKNIHDIQDAVYFSVKVSLMVLTTIVFLVWLFLDYLVVVFSNDVDFQHMLTENHLSFLFLLLTMNFAVFFEKVVLSLGKASAVSMASLFGSWCVQVPVSYFGLEWYGKSLAVLNVSVGLGYATFIIMLAFITYRVDFKALVNQ